MEAESLLSPRCPVFSQGRKEGQDFPHIGIPIFAQSPFGTGKRLLATGDVAIWSRRPLSWDALRHAADTWAHTDQTTRATQTAFYSQGTLCPKGWTKAVVSRSPSLSPHQWLFAAQVPRERGPELELHRSCWSYAGRTGLPLCLLSSPAELHPLQIKSRGYGHTEHAQRQRDMLRR